MRDGADYKTTPFGCDRFTLSSNRRDDEELLPKSRRAASPKESSPIMRDGADYKIRTCDLNLGKVALYQLS